MVKKMEKRVFHTIVEFEKEFFPNALKKRSLEQNQDTTVLGSDLARESLNKIRERLAKA